MSSNPERLLRFLGKLTTFACAAAMLGCGGGGASSATPGTGGGGTPPSQVSVGPNVVFILTDDHGYADLGAQGVVADVKTPNIDKLASNGVRMTAGYVTAPQCTPSRSAIMSGRYQQKFNMDDNGKTPFPLSEPMLPELLKTKGYRTGMVGKWHLDVDPNSREWFKREYPDSDVSLFNPSNIPFEKRRLYYPDRRGFDEVFFGYRNSFFANFSLEGELHDARQVSDNRFRVDVVSDAAVSFIKRNYKSPFFLYVSYYAPHVPLEASEKYLARFPVVVKERRRYALAMLSAVDDGVGQIIAELDARGIGDNTLVFFVGDNGAPLGMTQVDAPINDASASWDGSINEPWVGEKGMLSEGGVRVPFIMQWKRALPAGMVFNYPVSTLDAVRSIVDAAGVSDASRFDGVSLLPYLKGEVRASDLDARALFWRFWNQAAVRKGRWKYIRLPEGQEMLFDLYSSQGESANRIADYPQVARELASDLEQWSNGLSTPGLPSSALNVQEKAWYEFYFSY
ncbi:MAG: sulfatase-like hydrolase/transferase [Pseudomonadota bacterium]